MIAETEQQQQQHQAAMYSVDESALTYTALPVRRGFHMSCVFFCLATQQQPFATTDARLSARHLWCWLHITSHSQNVADIAAAARHRSQQLRRHSLCHLPVCQQSSCPSMARLQHLPIHKCKVMGRLVKMWYVLIDAQRITRDLTRSYDQADKQSASCCCSAYKSAFNVHACNKAISTVTSNGLQM